MGRLLIIVPARGGSKGISGKNLRPLAGYPLLQWTLTVASQMNLPTWVSTEDARIADLAENFCQVIHRPAHLARDLTEDLPVAQHALSRIGWRSTDRILWLRPTSPFRRAEELTEVLSLLDGRVDSVRSVRPARDHPQKCYLQCGKNRLKPATEAHAANSPRQGLILALAATGFIDGFWARVPMKAESMEGEVIRGWQSPSARSLDLDTEVDWSLAEQLAMERGWQPGHVT